MRERVSRRRALAALGLTGSGLLAGCNALGSNEDEPSADEDDSDDADTATEPGTDTRTADDDSEPFAEETEVPYVDPPYGLTPSLYEPISLMETVYEPMRKYLSEELAETEFRHPDDYSALFEDLENGDVAFAAMDTLPAAFAIKNDVVDVGVQRRAFGTWEYTGVVVTREDSDIETLADLDGAKIAFANPLSLSGSLFPLRMLKQAGLAIGDAPGSDAGADFEGIWGSHAMAFKSLADEQVDAACVGEFIALGSDRTLRDGFEYVDTYEGIPRSPMVTSPSLGAETRSAFVDAIRNAPESVYHGEDGDPNTDDDLWFNAVRPVDAATYEPVVELVDDLELTLDGLDQ